MLRDKLVKANAILAVDYRGLSVSEATDLRSRLRSVADGQIEYRVAKNTLLKRAIAGTDMEGLHAYLTGPTAVALAPDEPSAMAKILVDFARENDKFQIKAAHTGSVNQAEKSLLELLDERLDTVSDEPIGTTREPIEGPSFGIRVFGHFPEVSFVLLPFAAMFLKVLYFRRRQAFGEHLVTALHINAGVFVIMILAAALNRLLTLLDTVTGWVPTGYGGIFPSVAMFVSIVYVGVSLHLIYRDNVVFCAVRTIIFLAAYLALAMVGLFAVAVILVL